LVGVALDPAPLFYSNDRDYVLVFRLVTDRATEMFNRVHGGG
jgi:hypothetical protein